MSGSKMRMVTNYVIFHKLPDGSWKEIAVSGLTDLLRSENESFSTGTSEYPQRWRMEAVKQYCNDWADENYKIKKRTFIIIDGEI